MIDLEQSIVTAEDLESWSVAPAATRWSIARLPAWSRAWWRPLNTVAARNLQRLLSLLPGDSPLVLIVGGGTVGNGAAALYADRRVRLVAFDIYTSPTTQFIADAHRLPLADGAVDAVVVQAVLEHVLDPDQVVREIHRVLRPDGLVYAETPFLQHVHAGPWDFVRYTHSGHRFLFRAFDELASGAVAGPGTVLLWTVDHVVRGLSRSQLAGRLARAACFWLRYLDNWVAPAFAMDGASALFFLGRRSDRELTPREIVGYYAGAQRTSGVSARERHRSAETRTY